MKKIIFLMLVSTILTSCGKKAEHSGHNMDAPSGNGNQALYDEIMNIHDEVMPKTESLYNLSKGLKVNLKEAKSDDEKLELQKRINYLDSVNQMMSNWMHEFKPLPDTTNAETANAYYETHLEKVKRVKEAINTALAIEK